MKNFFVLSVLLIPTAHTVSGILISTFTIILSLFIGINTKRFLYDDNVILLSIGILLKMADRFESTICTERHWIKYIHYKIIFICFQILHSFFKLWIWINVLECLNAVPEHCWDVSSAC